MSKLNTRAKTYLAMSSYKLPNGTQAQWMCQYPDTWKAYIADLVRKYCIEQWTYADDIPEIVQNVMDETIGAVLLDVFYPYREEYADYVNNMRGAECTEYM